MTTDTIYMSLLITYTLHDWKQKPNKYIYMPWEKKKNKEIIWLFEKTKDGNHLSAENVDAFTATIIRCRNVN